MNIVGDSAEEYIVAQEKGGKCVVRYAQVNAKPSSAKQELADLSMPDRKKFEVKFKMLSLNGTLPSEEQLRHFRDNFYEIKIRSGWRAGAFKIGVDFYLSHIFKKPSKRAYGRHIERIERTYRTHLEETTS